MDILTLPNDILKTRANDVTDFAQIKTLVDEMIATATSAGLVGLAANQVGILQRVFVVDINATDSPDENRVPNFVPFINPKTKVNHAKGKNANIEGCGSVPNLFGLVERWTELTITAQDVDGKEFTMNLRGMVARIAQHERDHLDGILFTSKVKRYIQVSKVEA